MKYDPDNNHRRSIRLKEYDYSRPGGYYFTIVTQNRQCLFGDISDDKMVLNDAGIKINQNWEELPNRFANIQLDLFVIMPNHIHGIIINVGAGLVPAQKR